MQLAGLTLPSRYFFMSPTDNTISLKTANQNYPKICSTFFLVIIMWHGTYCIKISCFRATNIKTLNKCNVASSPKCFDYVWPLQTTYKYYFSTLSFLFTVSCFKPVALDCHITYKDKKNSKCSNKKKNYKLTALNKVY